MKRHGELPYTFFSGDGALPCVSRADPSRCVPARRSNRSRSRSRRGIVMPPGGACARAGSTTALSVTSPDSEMQKLRKRHEEEIESGIARACRSPLVCRGRKAHQHSRHRGRNVFLELFEVIAEEGRAFASGIFGHFPHSAVQNPSLEIQYVSDREKDGSFFEIFVPEPRRVVPMFSPPLSPRLAAVVLAAQDQRRSSSLIESLPFALIESLPGIARACRSPLVCRGSESGAKRRRRC